MALGLALGLLVHAPVYGQQDSLSSAWIMVDAHRLFQVAETQDLTAKQRAQGINAELAELVEAGEPLAIDVDTSSYTPIIYNALGRSVERQLMSVTANDLRLNQPGVRVQRGTLADQARTWADVLERWIIQARRERSGDYLVRAMVVSFAVLLTALVAHYGLGYLWRQYGERLLPDEPVPLPAGHSGVARSQFSLARLLAALLLGGLRLGLWLTAIIFAIRRFRGPRIWTNRLQELLVTSFVRESLPLGETTLSVADIFVLLGWLGALIALSRLVVNTLRSRLLQTSGLDLGMQAAIAILVRYVILFMGVIVILQLWGIDLSSLTLLASALGVGLGLGLQNIAKDISSGLVLVFERPIQVGDFVELNGQMGTVDRIGPRSTDIYTLDQISIIVPNSQFLEQTVINWSHRNPLSRIHIPVGVAYGSDPEQVAAVLLKVGRSHSQVMAAPAPVVMLQAFGDSALEFELLVWIRRPQQQMIVRSDLNFAIAAAFKKFGIQIPFPQRDVHFPSKPLAVEISEDTLRRLNLTGSERPPSEDATQKSP